MIFETSQKGTDQSIAYLWRVLALVGILFVLLLAGCPRREPLRREKLSARPPGWQETGPATAQARVNKATEGSRARESTTQPGTRQSSTRATTSAEATSPPAPAKPTASTATRQRPSPTSCPKDLWNVVVVGGGIAGLSAAYFLKRAGVRRLLVLERQRRVGGKARGVVLAGIPVVNGTEYVGKLWGPLRQMARELRLRPVQIPYPMDLRYIPPKNSSSQGQWYCGVEGRALFLAQRSRYRQRRVKIRQKKGESFVVRQVHGGLNEYNRFLRGMKKLRRLYKDVPQLSSGWAAQKLDQMSAAAWFQTQNFSPVFRQLYERTSLGLFGASLKEISAYSMIPEFAFDFQGESPYYDLEKLREEALDCERDRSEKTGAYTFRGGLGQLTTALGRSLGRRLLLGARALSLRWHEGKYRLHYRYRGSKQSLTTRAVILAVPAPLALRLASSVLHQRPPQPQPRLKARQVGRLRGTEEPCGPLPVQARLKVRQAVLAEGNARPRLSPCSQPSPRSHSSAHSRSSPRSRPSSSPRSLGQGRGRFFLPPRRQQRRWRQMASLLAKIPYAPYVTVVLHLRNPFLRQGQTAFDLAFPRPFFFTDIYDSTWIQRAYQPRRRFPSVVSLYIPPKGFRDSSILRLSARALRRRIVADLRRAFPRFPFERNIQRMLVRRFYYAYPVMIPGAYERLRRLHQANRGSLLLAGDYLLYPTFDYAAWSGKIAAKRAIAFLRRTTSKKR